MQLSQILIYPIKSLGGISLPNATLTPRGLQHDRRFMLTTTEGVFMTQRSHRAMALLKTAIMEDQVLVWHKDQPENVLHIPLRPTHYQQDIEVSVWGTSSIARVMPTHINQWFQEQLATDCQLVYMPDTAERRMKEKYSATRDLVSFADSAPILIIGQAGLDDLNRRLDEPVPMNRFRPNLVFTGGTAFAEDEWSAVKIGTESFKITHRCVRCSVLNINQETARMEKEPNRTLASFRQKDQKIYFGVHAVWQPALSEGTEQLSVGDSLVSLGIKSASN